MISVSMSKDTTLYLDDLYEIGDLESFKFVVLIGQEFSF